MVDRDKMASELEVDEETAEVREMRCMFPEEYLSAFLSAGLRPDGRKIYGGRQVTLNVGSVSTANGSAFVRFGETLVVCGVKAELVMTTPTSFERPIVCNVEVPPCSSSSVTAGPPTTPTQSLSQTLQTIVQKCIDTDQLLLGDGKLHWVLYVDVLCLCDHGNLLDPACFAAIAALQTTLLPSVDVSEDTPVVSIEKTSPLKLSKTPMCVTFALLSRGQCLLDPNTSEEELAEGGLIYCLADWAVLQLTHSGAGVSSDLILSLGKVAQEQAQNLLKLLHKVTQQQNS